MGHFPRTFHFRWSAVAIVLAMMAALVPLAATPPAAAATYTYYVDNTDVGCSDAGSGTVAAPFCTIGKAASLLTAGKSVHVVAGTYAETVNGPNSGTAGNPITYSAAPGVTVTGNGTASGNAFRMTSKSYIVIDGFTITDTVDYGIYASGSNHITISNDHVSSAGSPVSGSTRMGIYFTNTDDSTITGNTTDHNSQDGIRLTGGSSGNLVSDNVSYANAEEWQRNATGIQVTGTGSDNNTIIHNITYANEDSGLQFYAGAQSNLVIGNLSYGNGDHGIDNNTAPNNTIVGNTVQGNVTAGINLEGNSGGATLANNISIDNGLRLQVGGGTASGQPSNIRVDATSVTGTTIDYDEVYLSSGTGMIQWNGTTYASLALFHAAVPGQETHGLEVDPIFASPAPIAQRPASAPFNVAVNSGDYHLTAGSPAIDSADSNASNEPSLDIEGQARVDDPATTDTGAGVRTYDDRGAYEYVPAANNAPVAVADSYTTAQDTAKAVAAPGVLGNDTDADSDPLTAVLDTDVSHGTLSLAADGSFTYTPTGGYSGPDSFTYHANDGTADSNVVTVSLTITPAANNAPVAVADSYTTAQDTAKAVAAPGVLGNDTDADSDPLTAVLDTDVSHGTLSLAADGSFTYTPTGGYSGPDSFTYHANDGTADSNVVTVSLTITPAANNAPVAVADSYTTAQDTAKAVAAPGVLGNDTDADSDPLTAVLDTDVSHGTLSLAADGSFTYTPTGGYSGPDSFTYHANDGTADSNVVTVSLTITPAANNAPVAVADSYTTAQDTAKAVAAPGVLGNDTDADSDPLTAVLDTDVSHGTLSLAADGSFTYTPTGGYSGPDSFTYHANDGTADSNVVTVSLTITPAASNTYYVDNTDVGCSDAGSGTVAAPFCTIGKAASLLTAGKSVHVVAGTYAETVNGPNSGTAGNPITYSAAPGVTVTGNGTASGNAFRMTSKSYIVIDGFTITDTVDYGIYASGSNHITISNDHVSSAGSPVSGSTRMGIYFTNTDDSTITGNTTDHNSQDGIRLTGGSSGNLVSDNVSYANAEEWQRNATGIQVTGTGSDNNTIIHNITYANEDSGLQFYAGAQSNLVIGNLSYGNGDHGIDNNTAPNNTIVGNTVQGNVTAGINLEGNSGGATLANNISIDNGLRLQVGGGTASGQPSNIRVDATSVTGTTIDYDEVYLSSGTGMIQWNGTTYASLALFHAAVPGQETHGLEVDPIFASPAPIAQRPASAPFNVAVNSGDYHLTAGSPAIDSADSNASNEPSLDIEGQARVDDPATTDTGAGVRTYDDRGAYEYVPAANNAPVLDPIGNQNAQVGTQLAFTATASDADNDPLTFSLDDGTSGQVPAGASITSGGDFTWTPTSGQQGTAIFDVCVTDSIAAPVCETISFTVSSGSLPAITSFTPTSGAVGTLVTITGTNFSGATVVKFGGVIATFNVVSDTEITATVPGGATTGKILVKTPAGKATSLTKFTVGSGSTPTITSFTPTSGSLGTLVAITGTNFTPSAVVQFNGLTGTGFVFVSPTKVKATVPAGAMTGPISVTTPSGTGTSATNFTVISGSLPTITSFTPPSGSVGTLVTITGTNFSGATVVKFGGVIATFNVVSDTEITATVPGGATTGKILVKTPAGKATSLTKFTVT